MLPGNKILHSKLLRPQPPNIVRRKRLYPLLAQIPQKSLTTVVAGAGFGKTTLIAEACAHLRLDSVWYRLDVTDKDFSTATQTRGNPMIYTKYFSKDDIKDLLFYYNKKRKLKILTRTKLLT